MPRNITVTFADGTTHTYRGAPDDVTPDQVEARASQEFGKPVKSLDGGREASQVTAPTRPKTFTQSAGEAMRDMAAGAVRGAGSIGATLLAPVDAAARAAGIQNDFIGRTDRRDMMTQGLQTLGADTDSTAFAMGKLGGEIAGTAGVGGVLAKPIQALASTRHATGLEPILSGVSQGLKTGGFRVGELAGTGLGTAARIGAGGAVGAGAAGLVNPSDAGVGAMIGGALPGATALAGRAGSALRPGGGMQPNPELMASAKEAIDAGYVIPPASINPSFVNRNLESISGKMATQQIASARNAEVSRDLVKKALNLPDDAPLNRDTLEGIRKEAGKAYAAISRLPEVPARSAQPLMNIPAQAAIKPAKLVEDLKQARNDAQTWFKAYNTTANPEALAKARAADALSESLEGQIEQYAASLGRTDLVPALREARRRIAQTYTVERAMNEATGSIDATVLGKLFKKGKPLSGGLEKVGRFGAAFPTVAKVPERVGSPDAHNLRTVGSLMLGALGGAGAGPAGLAAGAIPYMAPPMARSLMFSRPMQRGLLSPQSAADGSLGLLTRGAYRALPLIGAQ